MTDQRPLFFAAQLAESGGTITLSREEARHATGARRLRDNDQVIVMDGQGGAISGRLRKDGALALVEVDEHGLVDPVSPAAVHLASAVPRGDRLSTLIDMATQIGLASFTPLTCKRSDHPLRDTDRARRIMLSAAKQSRRYTLPLLNDQVSVSEYIEQSGASGQTVFIAHPGKSSTIDAVLHDRDARDSCAIVVGPEGGFTDDEVSQAERHGAIRIGLGSHVLRIETACIVALTQFHQTLMSVGGGSGDDSG